MHLRETWMHLGQRNICLHAARYSCNELIPCYFSFNSYARFFRNFKEQSMLLFASHNSTALGVTISIIIEALRCSRGLRSTRDCPATRIGWCPGWRAWCHCRIPCTAGFDDLERGPRLRNSDWDWRVSSCNRPYTLPSLSAGTPCPVIVRRPVIKRELDLNGIPNDANYIYIYICVDFTMFYDVFRFPISRPEAFDLVS